MSKLMTKAIMSYNHYTGTFDLGKIREKKFRNLEISLQIRAP